ncbi:MAG: thioesterase family protein [Gammaproteobacteria bacterium]
MNLYFRLLALWLRGRFLRGHTPLAPSRVAGRVWPNDLDLFGHVNNGRYLTLMDLGRLDHLLGSGLVGIMRRRHWYGVVAAVEIRFQRPLKFWQHYVLVTEIVDWDEAWFVFEQRFETAGKPVARALVQAQFRKQRERVPTAEVFAALGQAPLEAPHKGNLVASLGTNVPPE